MPASKKEIKVEITYTAGYQQRFTAACLEILKRREKSEIENCSSTHGDSYIPVDGTTQQPNSCYQRTG